MHIIQTIPINQYKAEKLTVLKQLGIRPTKAIKLHIASLENDIQVDNYARTLILQAK